MVLKIEDFVYNLQDAMKADFSSFIDAVNTERGDTMLSHFADESYFIQTLDERVANYDQFVIIQAGNPTMNGTERSTSLVTYPISVYMSFDAGTTDTGGKKLYRYLDALVRFMLDKFWEVSLKPFKILNLDQMALIDIDKSKRVVATGITLEVSFGL